MALLKEIKDSKGLITKYHRISSFTINKDSNVLNVYIKSYADESYRELEKRIINLKLQRNELSSDIASKRNEIDLVKFKGTEDSIPQEETDKRVEELLLQISELESNINKTDEEISTNEIGSTFLLDYTYNIPLDLNKSYNITEIYNELKETNKFKKAEDII